METKMACPFCRYPKWGMLCIWLSRCYLRYHAEAHCDPAAVPIRPISFRCVLRISRDTCLIGKVITKSRCWRSEAERTDTVRLSSQDLPFPSPLNNFFIASNDKLESAQIPDGRLFYWNLVPMNSQCRYCTPPATFQLQPRPLLDLLFFGVSADRQDVFHFDGWVLFIGFQHQSVCLWRRRTNLPSYGWVESFTFAEPARSSFPMFSIQQAICSTRTCRLLAVVNTKGCASIAREKWTQTHIKKHQSLWKITATVSFTRPLPSQHHQVLIRIFNPSSITMHLLQQVAAASAFASIVAAAPYPIISKRSSNVTGAAKFTVPQGPPKLQGKKIAGPIALARVYGKYVRIGANAPAKVNAAASKAAGTNDGTVVASPEQYDQAYLESVTVGGQTLNLDFDTGSSDLYVYRLYFLY